MSMSDMVVFNQFLMRSYTETIDQQVRLFNQASGGTLILRSARNIGDYSEESFFATISGLVRRRDAYGTGSVSAVDLSQLQINTVKVAGGTPPIRWEPQQFSYMQRNQEEAGVVIGVQLAEGVLQDYLNTAVSGAVAAVSNNGAMVYDGTAGNLSLSSLLSGAAKMGDRSQSLRSWIVHSKAMFDLWQGTLTNSNTLFQFGDVKIMEDGFGRRFIVTDSPSLVTAGSPDEYHTLGLVEMAAIVEENDDMFSNLETSNGTENIQRTWQAEYTFNLGLKGYSWNESAGGKSPDNTEIGTGTNWPQIATSDKNTAGVLVNSD